LFFQLTTTY